MLQKRHLILLFNKLEESISPIPDGPISDDLEIVSNSNLFDHADVVLFHMTSIFSDNIFLRKKKKLN